MLLAVVIAMCVTVVTAISIPFIANVVLVPVYSPNSTMIQNITCAKCLCVANFSSLLVNCFPNNSCQFFATFPRTYRLEPLTQARLYFPKRTLPNASQCCMPDLDYLLDKLRNATPTSLTGFSIRALLQDNQGRLVTVEGSPPYIDRVDANNLSILTRKPLFTAGSTARNLASHDGKFFFGLESNKTVIIESDNLTVMTTIASSAVDGPRDIMFLKNGSLMVVASSTPGRLVFFNRTSSSPLDYSLVYTLNVPYQWPHGLTYINDTFFYATSWGWTSVYSYSAISGNSTSWTERLVANASTSSPPSAGSRVIVDECGRHWFTLYQAGVKIYSSNWVLMGNFSKTNMTVFDILIAENYVIYISDDANKQLIRIDPQIVCS